MPYMGKVDVKASDIKRFSVTGSTSATHVLSWTAPSEQALIITINGVKQQDGAYTIAGTPTTITLSSALVATDEMEVIGINDIGQTNTVAQDSIVTDMIRDDAVTSAKLDTNIAIDGDLTVDTDTLHVDSTNNRVGIGTSSPSYPLVVSGGGSLSNNDTSIGLDISGTNHIRQRITTPTAGGYQASLALESNSNEVVISTTGSNEIRFATSASERMRITSGGGVNVGSGVLSAASNDGDIVADLGVVIGTYNGDNRIAASSLGGGSATLYIGNAAIQVSSDERLKTNIADTTMSAVDKIKQVRIVDFNWNDPSDTSYNNRNARGTWTGVIAQELIDVFPFAVNAPRKEEDLSIDIESEKKWQVDQAHLVPVLMKAIQEQQTIIESLEARVAALESN